MNKYRVGCLILAVFGGNCKHCSITTLFLNFTVHTKIVHEDKCLRVIVLHVEGEGPTFRWSNIFYKISAKIRF